MVSIIARRLRGSLPSSVQTCVCVLCVDNLEAGEMATISCARCGARNRTPEDRNLRLRCAQCKTELPNEFILKQLSSVRGQLLDVLDVLPRVSTAAQMRETEETLGRTADLYANIVELPLLKANPAIYDDLMRECEHLAGEVQIVMGGSLKR